MRFWQPLSFIEPEQLLPAAQASEAAGFYGVTLSDHLLYPAGIQAKYPYSEDGSPPFGPDTPWPDVWCSVSAMAAVTTTLHFGNSVFIAPLRNVYVLAKQISTAAVISGNRVSLGAGVGWMKEEFDLLGESFSNRGKRFTEMISVMRTLWGGGLVEFHGNYYDVPLVQMSPAPTAPIPIYCGGDSDAAKERAVTVGDGWLAVGARSFEDILAGVTDVRRRLERSGRDIEAFEIIAKPGSSGETVDNYRRLADAGVTAANAAPWTQAAVAPGSFASPLQAKVDAMNRFGDEIISKFD